MWKDKRQQGGAWCVQACGQVTGNFEDWGTVDSLNRRELLTGAAAAGVLGAAAIAGCSSDGADKASPASTTTLPAHPAGKDAPFDHVVVLMMENRSFDHLLGWLPGANGKTAGLTFRDTTGVKKSTWEIKDDPQGCNYADPKHFWQHMERHVNNGRMDGFLATQAVGDLFPISYYRPDQIPCLAALAENFTTFDNYFCSFNGPTWPNRLYQHAATTDVDMTGVGPGPSDSTEFAGPDVKRPSNLELAIWDRLHDAGLTGRYYYHAEPATGLFQSGRYDKISFTYDKFLADAKAGNLPNVSFVDPDYGLKAELTGTSNDMHPHGSVTVGDAFLGEVYEAVRDSPNWDRTVFVINFDESGGFYDHVPPPKVADDTAKRRGVEGREGYPDYTQLGPRVPAIAISPFAPKKIASEGPYEHCSILKMIEWRWDLEPMTLRDKGARNLADALDFSQRREPIALPKHTKPEPTACPA